MASNKKTDKKLNVAKLTASYNRKVNLRAVSSQYDNIAEGLYATCWITFEDKEDFDKKAAALSYLVRHATENEIGKSISNLLKMSKDEDNGALLGINEKIDREKFIEDELGDLDSLIDDAADVNEVIATIEKFEEVDMEQLVD